MYSVSSGQSNGNCKGNAYNSHYAGRNKEEVDEVFKIEGEYVLVESIPAEVCTRCGEQSVGLETVETVRQAIHGGATPARSIELRVFEFAPKENIRTADVTVS